jgi:hypothetical protein
MKNEDSWDYRPKGRLERLAKVVLNSKTWHPTRAGMLRFEARITMCSSPSRVKVGGRALSRQAEMWLVGPWDSFVINGDVEMVMIGRFDPSFDFADVARTEGLTIIDINELDDSQRST